MEKMKNWDWDRIVPLGMDGWKNGKSVGFAVAAGWVCSWLWFLLQYDNARSDLFDSWDPSRLIPGAVMRPFYQIWDHTLFGFGAAALCMLPVALRHYFYHYQDSRSIYLMRRLPDRWDLWRRCLALPLLGLAACIILAVLNTLLYYGIYQLCTPRQCLEPGQWRMLWENLTQQGGTRYAGN